MLQMKLNKGEINNNKFLFQSEAIWIELDVQRRCQRDKRPTEDMFHMRNRPFASTVFQVQFRHFNELLIVSNTFLKT